MSEQIYNRVIALEIKHSHHESDLYIPVNEQTQPLIKEYEFASNVTTFKNNIDGKLWYDIPFAYLPYWDTKNSAV